MKPVRPLLALARHRAGCVRNFDDPTRPAETTADAHLVAEHRKNQQQIRLYMPGIFEPQLSSDEKPAGPMGAQV